MFQVYLLFLLLLLWCFSNLMHVSIILRILVHDVLEHTPSITSYSYSALCFPRFYPSHSLPPPLPSPPLTTTPVFFPLFPFHPLTPSSPSLL